MSEYHEHSDLSLLPELRKLDGPGFEGFVALDKTVGRSDGTIPVKYRELIAIGVALTTQCPYCLEVHTANAKKAGATREELAETVHIAVALRAGAALTHGLLAVKLFDKA
ncbi:MAG TPA: carboxymuconolactone decarboxylase family protein [Candidatus Cybelea sp.]|nr:carboxymuconolactone decarboxylase family protein [Candidatus Cybelea sp.]